MAKNETTSALIDGLLKTSVAGGLVMVTLATPNALQTLDKPLKRFFNRMDRRSREREYQRLLRYMKREGLITYRAKDYEHGIRVTKAGMDRIRKANLKSLAISHPKHWDQSWRLILFDIPKSNNRRRYLFTCHLKKLGFRQLQQSVWVYPFECRVEVEILTYYYGLNRYISYIKTDHIDNHEALIKRFNFRF